MGVPLDIVNIGGFNDGMTQELKIALTSAAEYLGMKITSLERNSDLNLITTRRRSVFHRELLPRSLQEESSEPKQTIMLYYDVKAVMDPSQNYGPILIQGIRDRHNEILGDLQASSNYYISDFDLCTTSSPVSYDNSDFNVCTLDHEIVQVKFTASNLRPDVDQEDFVAELLNIYLGILNQVNGLEIASMSLKRVSKASNSIDVYSDLDVIDRDGRSWETVIDSELLKESTKNTILEQVRKYLIDSLGQSGEAVEVCVDGEGVISMECTGVKSSKYKLPTWAIISIAAVSGAIVLCICISLCICAYQDAKDEDEMNKNVKAFVKDPELWRQVQIDERKKRSRPPPRKERKRRVTPERRRRSRNERHRRHSPRQLKYDRSYSPQRRRSTKRNKPIPLPALPPPQYNRPLPPPPQYNRPQTPEPFLALPPPPPSYEQNPEPYLALPAPYQQVYQQNPEPYLALPAPHPVYRRPHSPPQDEWLAIEGPVYCDDEMVNRPEEKPRPDPPAMMLVDRHSQGSETTESSCEYLPIMPPGSPRYH
jgi:hypothetical protein